jgi:hypothetical protein
MNKFDFRVTQKSNEFLPEIRHSLESKNIKYRNPLFHNSGLKSDAPQRSFFNLNNLREKSEKFFQKKSEHKALLNSQRSGKIKISDFENMQMGRFTKKKLDIPSKSQRILPNSVISQKIEQKNIKFSSLKENNIKESVNDTNFYFNITSFQRSTTPKEMERMTFGDFNIVVKETQV